MSANSAILLDGVKAEERVDLSPLPRSRSLILGHRRRSLLPRQEMTRRAVFDRDLSMARELRDLAVPVFLRKQAD
jgi:hypothetical protein